MLTLRPVIPVLITRGRKLGFTERLNDSPRFLVGARRRLCIQNKTLV